MYEVQSSHLPVPPWYHLAMYYFHAVHVHHWGLTFECRSYNREANLCVENTFGAVPFPSLAYGCMSFLTSLCLDLHLPPTFRF